MKTVIALLLLACFGYSKEILLGVGYSLPPYVIEKTNSGMELQIVREALATEGFTVKPVYIPAARLRYSLADSSATAVMTVNEQSGITGFYSQSHIYYQNVVMSRSAMKLRITKISDLGRYSIVAWQDAKLYMGEEYAAMAKLNKRYSELAQQEGQVAMLMAGRTDLIVIDKNIFAYYSRQSTLPVKAVPTRTHELFPRSYYNVCFINKNARDAFNRGLAKLKKSGRYDAITAEYLGAPLK